jgi:tRNA(fMet)-specific endonuclease VapC
MSYLLDTNVCIALINGTSRRIRARFDREVVQGVELFVPSVVAFELYYGAVKSQRRQENERSVDTLLSNFAPPLSFGVADAKRAGEVRAALESVGTPIGAYDYLIAAQALNRKLTVVTANEREFRRVSGLRVENWTQ